MGVISRHPSNIRCLQINPRSMEDYEFLTLKMENLEHLYIKDGFFCRQPIPSASHLTKLRAVILQRLATVPHDAFIKLTDLTLHNIVYPMLNLVDMLQANQTLERIRFNATVVEDDPHERLVSLPNLKLLCISHSSPIAILHILSPLPTPSRVIIHDATTGLEALRIESLFNPFLMFGPNDLVREASISILSGEASITFHTSNDATAQIIIQAAPMVVGGEHPAEFSSLLRDVPQWGPFPDLRSMHLHIEPAATGPIDVVAIYHLLSVAPRMARLSFNGSTLFHHISHALSLTQTSGHTSLELELLGGTLRADDAVIAGLRSLSGAVRQGSATIQRIALCILGSEEEIAGILAEAGPLIEGMASNGVHEVLLTPWDRSYDVCSF